MRVRENKQERKEELVVDDNLISEFLISSIMPSGSKMGSCWTFMPPIG